MLLSDVAWVTVSRNLHSQSNRCWCYENPYAVHEVLLHDFQVQRVVEKSKAQCFLNKQIPSVTLN